MTQSTERALSYEPTEFTATASELLTRAADLVDQFGFNKDVAGHRIKDVPGTAGYALHEAVDQAAFGQPVPPLFVEMGLQNYPVEYKKAVLLLINHIDAVNHGDVSEEAVNGWHQSQTRESFSALLRLLAEKAAL